MSTRKLEVNVNQITGSACPGKAVYTTFDPAKWANEITKTYTTVAPSMFIDTENELTNYRNSVVMESLELSIKAMLDAHRIIYETVTADGEEYMMISWRQRD